MSALEIIPAGDAGKATIANLIQLYLYDMTDEDPFPVGADGRFEYDFLDRFWQHPYLLRVDGELAGFALVIDDCPVTDTASCHFMAEFFVLRAYRGRGVGRQAADEIISHHPGRWHIGVITGNKRAAAFWSKCLDGTRNVTKSEHDFDGAHWLLREFVSA